MNLTPFSLRARWVLPIDRSPVEGGYVTVLGGRIVEISRSPPMASPVEDLGDVALLPGFVNAHTHLEFSDLVSPLGRRGMSLPEWIRLVIGERKRSTRDASAGSAAGLAESAAAGVTTIGDIATAPRAHDGIGGPWPRPTVVAFQEAIGFSALRVDSAFGDVSRRLTAGSPGGGLSPHAPYTVHPRLLERVVQLAEASGVPVAMHLAESREELQLLADGDGEFRTLLEERSMWDDATIPRGSRPLDYLRRLAAGSRSLVIHGNYLAEDEIVALGRWGHRMSVVFCPRTHDYFGHAPYPLDAMRRARVHVALGTDSRASNPDLSMLAELRFAAKRFPEVEPEVWLRMATLDAATALGVGDEVGTLNVGKRADLIAIPIGDAAEPNAAIVGGESSVARVWIGGRELAGR